MERSHPNAGLPSLLPAKKILLTFNPPLRDPRDMPEGSHHFQVGSICCTVLSDGYFSYPTPWFFPNAD